MTERYYYAETTQQFAGTGECAECMEDVRVESVAIDGYDIIDSQTSLPVAFCEKFHHAITVVETLNK